jgi:ATP-dependent Clp protease ATP-binding subunit ClpA
MYERFSDRARASMRHATYVALAADSDLVLPTHVLAGFLFAGGPGVDTVATELEGAKLYNEVLAKLGLTVEDIALTETKFVGCLPLDSATKKIVERAMEAARSAKSTYVGTEHMLIGLSDCLAEHGIKVPEGRPTDAAAELANLKLWCRFIPGRAVDSSEDSQVELLRRLRVVISDKQGRITQVQHGSAEHYFLEGYISGLETAIVLQREIAGGH